MARQHDPAPPVYTERYTYETVEKPVEGLTGLMREYETGRVKTFTLDATMQGGWSEAYTYTYDEVGNITKIEKDDVVIATYAYDALNQLVSATQNGVTYLYQYDNGGNITGRSTSDGNGAFYTYGDTTWRDLLTAYNGQAITYDTIGNPLTYRGGMAFTWEGRQMQTATGISDGVLCYIKNYF